MKVSYTGRKNVRDRTISLLFNYEENTLTENQNKLRSNGKAGRTVILDEPVLIYVNLLNRLAGGWKEGRNSFGICWKIPGSNSRQEPTNTDLCDTNVRGFGYFVKSKIIGHRYHQYFFLKE